MTNVYCWAATHVGHVRTQNEDALAVSARIELTPAGTWEGHLPGPSAWAVVADGMGGHAAGEVASRLAVEVLQLLLPHGSASCDIEAALTSADWAIRDAMKQRPDLRGMGTTVCGVLAVDDTLAAFNVGDSRIYLMDGGNLQQLSDDHVVHGHVLTQCLGGSSEPRALAPSIVLQKVPKKARVLLCSDGLTDLVSDECIGDLLVTSGRPAEELVEAALERGGVDNVTAVVLQFEPS